jgi:hypothetical protein
MKTKKTLKQVRSKVQAEISGFANEYPEGTRSGLYSRGLASEGYDGGYRDAIDDVMLFLNGVTPDRRGWWPDETV